MKVKIFTEGGRDIGLGHISRCSSLYDEIERRGIEVQFIISSDVKNVDFLKSYKIKNDNWLSRHYLNNNIDNTDYCIVDSYLASKDLYQIISNKSKKALYIDDNARIKYPKGIIVNPSLNIDKLDYIKNDENIYLLGAKYIILRNPFINVKRNSINEHVKEVFVTMGGSDIRNLTPKILKEICKKYPEIKFNVVIGNAFHNVEIIESIKLKNVELYYNIDAQSMKDLMLKSDFAITAAGQTIYELLATQTPFIPIKVVENQNNNIKGLKKINSNQIIIEYNNDSLLKRLKEEFDKILNFNYRKSFNETYISIIDGFGSQRIINNLL